MIILPRWIILAIQYIITAVISHSKINNPNQIQEQPQQPQPQQQAQQETKQMQVKQQTEYSEEQFGDFPEYAQDREDFIVERKMGPLGLRPTTIRRTPTEKEFIEEYKRYQERRKYIQSMFAQADGEDELDFTPARESHLCPYCRNPISKDNRSIRCNECENLFCATCEIDFRGERRRSEPAMCANCYLRHKRDKFPRTPQVDRRRDLTNLEEDDFSEVSPHDQLSYLHADQEEEIEEVDIYEGHEITEEDIEELRYTGDDEWESMAETKAEILDYGGTEGFDKEVVAVPLDDDDNVEESKDISEESYDNYQFEDEDEKLKHYFEMLADKFEKGEITSEEYERLIEEAFQGNISY